MARSVTSPMPIRSADAGRPEEKLADVLGEFARTMVTDFPIQRILDHLVKRIVDIMPVDSAGVTLITPGLTPRYVAASDPDALRFEKLQTELGEGPCLAAYQTGRPVSIADLRDEGRFPRFTPRALEAGLIAAFTFPLNHGEVRLGALDLYRRSAGELPGEMVSTAQTLADVAAAYLINAQARSDLQDASEQSRVAALHDPLTGLPNRVLLLQLLQHASRVALRSGRSQALCFVDLDRFKEVNDSYGHQVGDELLVAVARRMTGLLRSGDSLARLHGDEFVVLCEDLADPSDADPIAARLDAELARPFSLSCGEVSISASIGIAFAAPGAEVPEDLLNNADLAMYKSKRDRLGGHDVLNLRQLHLEGYQAGLARGLPGAIERGELHVDYQPIVEAAEGRLIGLEALLRWDHPDRGPVSPAVFIPFAEQSGQIVELGRWVLDRAWADRREWQGSRPEQIAMSVNVSAHQFNSAGFVESVAAVLAQGGDPGLLTLEVTERMLIGDDERALVVLGELKALGVKLALDDFGTGYSSLAYLTGLPIDTIKLDPEFTRRLSDSPSSRAIITAIIGLAHSLEMAVVSEGVETAEQRDTLAQLGSDCCQGFYFAPPLGAENVDALIQGPQDGTNPYLPAARFPVAVA